jgi:hypothetical protein
MNLGNTQIEFHHCWSFGKTEHGMLLQLVNGAWNGFQSDGKVKNP